MWGQWGMADIVYEDTVKDKISQNGETYTGLTYRPFEESYKEHNYDTGHSKKIISSRLAGHIWNLKDKGEEFDITWKILARMAWNRVKMI